MRTSVLALAAVAALSTAVYAGERKPVQMTDEQIDAVTAAGGGQHLVITASGGNGGLSTRTVQERLDPHALAQSSRLHYLETLFATRRTLADPNHEVVSR
jgi:hypothetical protein